MELPADDVWDIWYDASSPPFDDEPDGDPVWDIHVVSQPRLTDYGTVTLGDRDED